ncbi:glycosyltransferase family 4 protein [Polaribacter sp. Q13]|uniref:glycosyltransferase family 4 protein n=1 Tax=Polaribacter sp. Q13 TaxID=2806551 RepID=UPI00193BE7D3|nr:glycosyltransferase family 4 protein [Polaribacter sp. Q13]QVY64753.1 glycosyltransferase family 4 protein [Polaribacter sp. Q13]
MKRILLVGPFPKPITGLSLANEVLYKGLKQNNKVDYIDMSYYRFEEVLGDFNFYKMIFFLKLNFKIFKIYNYDSIYITIGQSFFGVIKYSLFFITAKIFGKKVVIHLHGNQLGEMYKSQSFLKKTIIKKILSIPNYGIVLSNSLKHNLSLFLKPQNIFVVENFVEDELYLNSKEINTKNYESLRIVYIGNLMTEKGVFYLLDALVSLKKKGVVFKAKFAGNIDNHILDSIMSYFKGNDNLEYLGVVRNKEKKEMLKWANTFVFPSYLVEGFPLSILEAIVTRNSVITTKHPALNDLFTEENLSFIQGKSTKDIVNSLTKQSLSFDKKRILNNFNIIKGFTEEEFVSKIEKIINL